MNSALRAVERARLLVHLGDEGVELADLLLHAQPCAVRSEEVRVLILQLLPHCAVLRPVTTVRGLPGQRAGRRTQAGQPWLDICLHFQSVHYLLLRHVQFQASFNQFLDLCTESQVTHAAT